jgi:hypothetical protein
MYRVQVDAPEAIQVPDFSTENPYPAWLGASSGSEDCASLTDGAVLSDVSVDALTADAVAACVYRKLNTGVVVMETEHVGELRRRDHQRAVRGLRPDEAPALQPLGVVQQVPRGPRAACPCTSRRK